MLLKGSTWTLSIPNDKLIRAVNMLQMMTQKKKATIKELEKLAGLLNFLNRAIFPGRAFTRRMYAKFTGEKYRMLKDYRHVKLDNEFKQDCQIWLKFLNTDKLQVVSRPFVDLSVTMVAEEVGFSTDSAGGKNLGFGCIFTSAREWCYGQWEEFFIEEYEPSIEFLELFALAVGMFTWIGNLRNRWILVHCDNKAVVNMIHSTSSSCEKCMALIRQLTLKCLQHILRIFGCHIMGVWNILPDLLSRQKIQQFKNKAMELDISFAEEPTLPTMELWPLKAWWNLQLFSAP